MPEPATPVAAAQEFVVARITPPMPVALASALYQAIADACEDQGYDAFCKEADGLGVVWVRPRAEGS